jgi:hypothetical protein
MVIPSPLAPPPSEVKVTQPLKPLKSRCRIPSSEKFKNGNREE